ncbi:sulfatase-like hydrolase/transferase [Dactylosporangium roseum]|uniref:Sulfatase-like hydrolase/transferase n=1 Tax=Dactylosporangium roseum TaxID=47989 RepID=A0ABY5YY24_9ACTN|nr:sulfatase-like hydrolase/transferase [Dactylosporangium roseum]UWZ34291.1 sulfatase-like hydrolase/transferase [Dactylosporangium roseum]
MSERRPNVVLILSDDHGYADRGATGIHPDVRTPALDRLAAEGVTLTEGYVTAPVCSPSRAGLIAGQYQARWGVHWFGDSRYPDHAPSLAEQFQGLGYVTGYLGKVHYGPERVGERGTPPHHGFDVTFYGLAGQQTGRLNYLRHSRAAVAEYGEFGTAVSAVQPMLEGDTEVDCEGFLTDELGRRARRFVTDSVRAGQPFFLMLAFNAVHNFCWQLPAAELEKRGLPTHADYQGGREDYLDWYDGQVRPNLENGREYYLAQLELMDAQIGRLLDTLDAQGVAEDTVVVYLTDNGGSNCNFADNTPLRGTKYTLWEGGVRVPYLLRWPAGGIPAGRHRDGPVSSMDLYPTLLAAAGAAPAAYAHCDGNNLLPLLRHDDRGATHAVLHWDNGFQWAVRAGRWKLLWVDPDSAEVQGLRDVEKAEPGLGWQLFDLAADPAETTDLAAAEPGTVAELRALHDRWRAEVAGRHVEPHPGHAGRK